MYSIKWWYDTMFCLLRNTNCCFLDSFLKAKYRKWHHVGGRVWLDFLEWGSSIGFCICKCALPPWITVRACDAKACWIDPFNPKIDGAREWWCGKLNYLNALSPHLLILRTLNPCLSQPVPGCWLQLFIFHYAYHVLNPMSLHSHMHFISCLMSLRDFMQTPIRFTIKTVFKTSFTHKVVQLFWTNDDKLYTETLPTTFCQEHFVPQFIHDINSMETFIQKYMLSVLCFSYVCSYICTVVGDIDLHKLACSMVRWMCHIAECHAFRWHGACSAFMVMALDFLVQHFTFAHHLSELF